MMPMLVIFQIPAAHHMRRIGYKQFVFAGWGIRVMFIGGMALVPLSCLFLSPTNQLALLLMLLFGFNLSRGISSCAWLPWITSLVPPSLRGQYLAWDAASLNISSTAAFCFAAFCLGSHPQPIHFTLLFVFSALMGFASLAFLKKIPDPPKEEVIRVSSTPVPWREIASFSSFRKLLRMNIAWSVAYGGLTAFIVAYLKSEAKLSEQSILLMTAVYFLGGLGSLWLLGSRLDHWGSKPVLSFALILWLIIMLGWTLIAGRVTPLVPAIIILLQLLMGLAYSMHNMANVRLTMGTIPPMGRDHFFALYSVVTNVVQGIAPVIWGVFIDVFAGIHYQWMGFSLNRFSLFFLAVGVVLFLTLMLCRPLEEPRARRMDEMVKDLLVSPARLWFRLWPRT
jgi:MFS family permease